MRWVTSETMEEHRLTIPVWFRGKVVTIGEMEDELVNERLDELFPRDDGNLKVFQDRMHCYLTTNWYNYLRTLNEDRYYKDKWVK